MAYQFPRIHSVIQTVLELEQFVRMSHIQYCVVASTIGKHLLYYINKTGLKMYESA